MAASSQAYRAGGAAESIDAYREKGFLRVEAPSPGDPSATRQGLRTTSTRRRFIQENSFHLEPLHHRNKSEDTDPRHVEKAGNDHPPIYFRPAYGAEGCFIRRGF